MRTVWGGNCVNESISIQGDIDLLLYSIQGDIDLLLLLAVENVSCPFCYFVENDLA